MATLAQQYIPALGFGYNWYNFAVRVCNTGSAQIQALTTIAGSGTTSLQGLFTLTAPPNYVDACRQAGNAMVDMQTIGVLNTTNIGTSATVTDVRNLLAAADPTSSLAGTSVVTFAFPI